MTGEMLGDQPAWTDEDQAAFEAEDAAGPADCDAYLRSPFDPARASECARLSPHGDQHAGLDASGRLISWTDHEEGAHRG